MIVGIGTIGVDLIAFVERFPRIGETVRAYKFGMYPGGKVYNAVTTAGKLAEQEDVCYMIGRLGNDMFGEIVRKKKSPYVSLKWCFQDHSKTNTPLIYVNQKKKNLIVTTPGASDNLSCQDIEEVKHLLKETKVCILETGISFKVAEYAASIVRESGGISVFIPAPVRKASFKFLKNFDFILPNETEASEISGIDISNLDKAKKAARIIHGNGIENVVITCADKGTLLCNGNGIKFFPSYRVDKVVDPTGAGDTFAGAFAYGLWKKLPLDLCVKLGNVAGALSVTKCGAGSAIPDREQVINFIKEKKVDIEVDLL